MKQLTNKKAPTVKPRLNARSWHKWTSLIVALPILIVAVTAIFIAHRKALGTDEINVAANWLPGYQGASAKSGRNEPRARLNTASGDIYIGTLSGLYRLADGQLLAIEELAGTPIRGLAETAWGRVAAAKSGIWLEHNGQWQRVLKGDAWSAASQPDGSIVVAIRDKGLLASSDGQRWQADAQLSSALARLPTDTAEPITLGKLVMDLHTGKALLGKDGEWVWIDLVALSLALLALTGLYMWWRTRQRKTARHGSRRE